MLPGKASKGFLSHHIPYCRSFFSRLVLQLHAEGARTYAEAMIQDCWKCESVTVDQYPSSHCPLGLVSLSGNNIGESIKPD